MRRKIFLLVALVAVLVASDPASAQQTADAAAADLAKQAQNPLASMISLPFQNNVNLGMGPHDRNQNVLNIQPVIPFGFGPVNLITRTIVPIVYRPDLSAESGGTSGLGDTSSTFWLSPSAAGNVTWGVGPVVYLPTATDGALGSGKWSAGPSAVALAMPGKWVIGVLASNVWSFAGGDEDDADVNSFLLQPIINYNLRNQWYLTSVSVITANWNASDGNKWTVPVGGGFGKIFHVGSQALNGQFQAFYNAVHPGPNIGPPVGGIPAESVGDSVWTLRFQIQLLFPR